MISLLKAIYKQYEHDVQELRQQASVFDGLFGLGNDPKNDRLHDLFYAQVGRWADEFLSGNPEQADVTDAVRWILEASALHRNEETYWYYYAAQSHAKAMIPLLAYDDCRLIRDWYDMHYPRIDRMPVQKEIFRLLSQCSK